MMELAKKLYLRYQPRYKTTKHFTQILMDVIFLNGYVAHTTSMSDGNEECCYLQHEILVSIFHPYHGPSVHFNLSGKL